VVDSVVDRTVSRGHVAGQEGSRFKHKAFTIGVDPAGANGRLPAIHTLLDIADPLLELSVHLMDQLFVVFCAATLLLIYRE
jgi:hypothetical protein